MNLDKISMIYKIRPPKGKNDPNTLMVRPPIEPKQDSFYMVSRLTLHSECDSGEFGLLRQEEDFPPVQ